MLSLQPKINYGTSFTARRELTPEEKEARKYYNAKRELEEQREQLEELKDNSEIKMPKVAKDMIKGGAVVTTGLLGGMATGWGAKKSIQAFSKINKSEAMQGIKKHIKATNKFIKDSAKTISSKFKESDAYKMPLNKIKKLETTKVGGPIIRFFKAIGNGIKKVYTTVKKGFEYILGKIRSVKKETYEKAAVNFTGASGGVAAGVTTLKEQDEKGKK